MDFWSRLLAQAVPTRSSRRDAAKDPIKRLHRFEKEYSQLLQIWRNSSNLAHDNDGAVNLEIRLQELTNILRDESHRPLPHPCIQFSSAKQIYVPIGKIATTSYNESIVHVAVHFFASLIESEEEAFVENKHFANSLTTLLVRITGPNSIRLAADTETKVAEIAFNITTKIRLDPSILPAWFKQHAQHHDERIRDERERFAGRTQKQDFPLFYLLMDYIHSEGKIGDFARTGLLYIIEAASSSVDLEEWIVESDLSTLMATGLGALYSQLSRKLVIDHPPQELPPILALSDYQHPRSTFEIVSSCTPDFQAHMETFLSHLLFWQDVLNHCRSIHVKQTLLEHFHVIFLQQLLYPSLLESSDIDGGSSVAVLTYLRRILEALDHPDMINLILHYLLGLPDAMEFEQSTGEDPVEVARKRKSVDLLTMMAMKVGPETTPMLFNLVDMTLTGLRSKNQQTIHVTLQLVSVILKRHHRYAVTTLLRTEPSSRDSRRTIGAHQQEVDFFMEMAGVIGGQDNFDDVYDSVLKDTMTRVEGHPCSLKLVAPKISTNNHKLPAIPDSLPGAPPDVSDHTLRPDDPLLNTLLDILSTFFINPVEINLAATEAIADLAVCGYMTMEGWLARDTQKYIYDDDTDSPLSPDYTDNNLDDALVDPAELAIARSMQSCRRRPRWATSTLPRLMTVIQALADGVESYRLNVPRFDDLLQQRREAFQTADALLSQPPPTIRKPTPGTPAPGPPDDSLFSSSPAKPSGIEGFAQRLLSELGTPSRTGSPRLGKESLRVPETPERPGKDSMSGGYGISTPTARPIPIKSPPKEFPINHDNPSRSGRGYSPAGSHGGHDTWSASDAAVESQKAAFAAVDQSILARRVGMPVIREADPIPIRLDRVVSALETEVEASGNEAAEAEVELKGIDNAKGDRNPHKGAATSEDKLSDKSPEPQQAVEAEAPDETTNEREADNSSAMVIEDEEDGEEKTVTVSHVITNVIILQFFMLELASLAQIRAGLFEEVRFV